MAQKGAGKTRRDLAVGKQGQILGQPGQMGNTVMAGKPTGKPQRLRQPQTQKGQNENGRQKHLLLVGQHHHHALDYVQNHGQNQNDQPGSHPQAVLSREAGNQPKGGKINHQEGQHPVHGG